MEDRRESLISRACKHLNYNGFFVQELAMGEKNPTDMTLIAMTQTTGLIVAVAVMDGDKVASIPLQGLGHSKKAKARAERLKSFAKSWMAANRPDEPNRVRYDAVWVASNCISHITNIEI